MKSRFSEFFHVDIIRENDKDDKSYLLTGRSKLLMVRGPSTVG